MTRRVVCRFLVAIFTFSGSLSADLLYVTTAVIGPNGVSVFDATTFLPTSPFLEIVGSFPLAIAVNPVDGTLVYTPASLANNLFVQNAGPPLSNFSGSPFALAGIPGPAVVSPDGALVYIPAGSGDFYVFDAHTLMPYMASPYAIPFFIPIATIINSAGTFVYVADFTGAIYKIDALTSTFVVGPDPVGGSCVGLVVSPDGTRLYALIDLGGTVQELDAVTLAAIGSPHPTGVFSPSGIVITPDGTRLFISSQFGTIAVLDAQTFAPIVAPFPSGGSFSTAIVINAAGTRVYVLNRNSKNISEIDAINPAVIGSPHDIGLDFPETLAIYSVLPPPPPPPPPVLVDPPAQLSGNQQKNNFGVAYELFNTLQWNASPTNGIAGYHIYRDGSQIATVNASTLQYVDHNRKKGVTTSYAVTAFVESGESAAITVVVQ